MRTSETARGPAFPGAAPRLPRRSTSATATASCTRAAFRRLVYKTQVFVNHEGDLYRTRLTHSLEVAQIARTVARALGLNEPLTEAICLAHDLGHTPFGHAGQDALRLHAGLGGFEHNLQSLRVVDELEERYAEFPGLNLSFETREGILKHCSTRNARRLGDLGERFLERRQPGLEAQLANLADEIAYNNHDVDDGLRAGLIGRRAARAVAMFRRQYERGARALPAARRAAAGARDRAAHDQRRRHRPDRGVRGGASRRGPADIEAVRARPEPLVDVRATRCARSTWSSSVTCASTSTGTTRCCA